MFPWMLVGYVVAAILKALGVGDKERAEAAANASPAPPPPTQEELDREAIEREAKAREDAKSTKTCLWGCAKLLFWFIVFCAVIVLSCVYSAKGG
jgi:uncharacterized membrane protein YtjA (UPF0391 family)